MWALPVHADTDLVARAAVVEGFNSNTYQAQDDPNVPIIQRHPSPFTGGDVDVEARFLGRDADRTTINVDLRGNHYTPLTPQAQSDDGAINAVIGSRITLGPRTFLTLGNSGTVTTLNGAHVTDGTIFAFDPTQERSTFWLDDFTLAFTHILSPRWRLILSLGGIFSGTISSAPTATANGELTEHRGLDYITPYVEADGVYDFTPRTILDALVRYSYSYQAYQLDLTQNPAQNVGPNKQAFLTALAGWTYHWNTELSTTLRGGAELGSAPPGDIDQRPVLGPAGVAMLYYTRPFFDFVASAGYTWGTVNPRLGYGPTGTLSFFAVGVPYHVGDWQNLALVARGQASYSSLVTGETTSAELGLIALGIEARYAITRTWGLLAGYDMRYAWFGTTGVPADQAPFNPPFLQNVFFVGVSGYFTNNRAILPITTFTAPVQPPS